MAYAVLFSLANTIDNRILNHDEIEYPISENGKQQIASLREQVKILQAFVEKFPEKAESLESRITTAANEAEDILEHFMYEHIRWHHKAVRSAAVGRPKVNHEIDLYDFRDLKFAMEEMNSIAREADVKRHIKTKHLTDAEAVATTSSSTLAAPLSLSGATVGLEKDLRRITDLLCEEVAELKVIPITGMGC